MHNEFLLTFVPDKTTINDGFYSILFIIRKGVLSMSTQKRNIWLDNVKGFLIICVVAGHFLESGIDYHSNMCKSLFLFIYSFHMPLFVFASGLMCEHAIQTKERFCKKLANFAGLYVLLKLLIFPFQRLTSPGLTFSQVKM